MADEILRVLAERDAFSADLAVARQTISDLRAALAAAAEREARLRGAAQRVLNETFAPGSVWINKDRITAALADLERALSPTPTEPQK